MGDQMGAPRMAYPSGKQTPYGPYVNPASPASQHHNMQMLSLLLGGQPRGPIGQRGYPAPMPPTMQGAAPGGNKGTVTQMQPQMGGLPGRMAIHLMPQGAPPAALGNALSAVQRPAIVQQPGGGFGYTGASPLANVTPSGTPAVAPPQGRPTISGLSPVDHQALLRRQLAGR